MRWMLRRPRGYVYLGALALVVVLLVVSLIVSADGVAGGSYAAVGLILLLAILVHFP